MKGYYLMPHPPIVIPEVGKGEEVKIQKTAEACNKISKDIANKDIETLIIISPHGLLFSDAISIITTDSIQGDLKKFKAPTVYMKLSIDTELTHKIIELSEKDNIPIVGLEEESTRNYGVTLELDHGAIVPLYFILKERTYKLVHITYGMLTPIELYNFGMCIKKAVDILGTSAALIASGDLSHRLKLSGPYSYSPYGKQFDSELMNILKNGDIEDLFSLDEKLIKEAGECGLNSLYILAGAMDGLNVKGDVLSYEGTFGVGYGIVNFSTNPGPSIFSKLKQSKEALHLSRMEDGNVYTSLARKSITYYLEHGNFLEVPKDLPADLLQERKGVFVSLKRNGDLRGCIGTIAPTTSSVAEEIIRNAVSSATADPRFPKVNRHELPNIDISVDVLYEPELATKEQLDPKQYGVIVSTNRRRGLLLPNLEGVKTIEEQLIIALEKGGIDEEEDYTIERFKVERHSEVNDYD